MLQGFCLFHPVSMAKGPHFFFNMVKYVKRKISKSYNYDYQNINNWIEHVRNGDCRLSG